MDASPSLHPTDQILSSFGLGKLDDRSAEAVNEHLMECSACRKRVAEISSDSFLGRFRGAQAAGKAPSGPSPTGGPRSDKGPVAAALSPAGTLPPELVNHADYEIKRELGRGGMGVVYLAHNTLMGRDEVLKVMGRQVMERPGVLERFLREIRAVASLRHPNIVTAYSAARIGESIVFAMEYVDGLDLSRLVKAKGPMPVAHACLFIHQAALGLQHAHEKGLVHRDIKPHNLMLSREGNKPTVKILDFGLAKAAREEKVDGGLTNEGQALGTPDYVAPEQILDAQSADIRADIYSLGGTLHYLLTGHPPFQAKSLFDLYQAHISRDADPLNLTRPEVPVELAALVSKMMAKEPSRRFQTPGEVAQALTPFFKKGNAALKSAGADISRADGTNTAGTVPPAVPAATQPATVADPLMVRPNKTAEPPAAERRWESIIEFREAESSPEVAKDVAPRRRTRWPLLVAAGVLGLFLLGVIIRVATDKGGIKIVVDDPKAVVKVDPIHNTKATAGREPVKTAEPDPMPAPVANSKEITNSIGMKLVLIPAGEFLMGSPDSDKDARAEEKPQHAVRITRPFYLGTTEVTVGQFRRFVERTGYRTEAEADGKGGAGWDEASAKRTQGPKYTWRNPGFAQTDDHPVVIVSWSDATAFCNELSAREGLRPFDYRSARGPWDGEGYRLPTEAEWEYACRAGTTARYQSGDDPETLAAVGNIADGTFKAKYPGPRKSPKRGNWSPIAARDGYANTAPVARFRPNAFGVYDMHGNVGERCWDGYEADYYGKSAGADPLGPSQAAARVNRGGNWYFDPLSCRSAARASNPPAIGVFSLGFRVARVQPGR